MITKKILTIINKVIPKSNSIIFDSFPAFSDNAWALYNYIISSRPDIVEKYDLIWAQEYDVAPIALPKAKYVKKKSVKGIWKFLRSRYVISTHTYSADLKSGNGQIQYNLWHGCGFKSMTEADDCYRGDETIVTSDAYRSIHARVFKMQEDHIHVTGLPRNDVLFKQSKARQLLGINEKAKIYLWMPTYRKAALGHDEIDGNPDSFGVSSITDEQLVVLNELFLSSGSFLIIKPHPMDSVSVKRLQGFSNILCYTNADLVAKGIILYELLSVSDTLLSDYSSVIIDYMLLDKPIVMVLSDKEEYQGSRGFVFEPIEEYMPGPIINDFDSLVNYFNNYEVIDNEWNEKRRQLITIFHKYRDNKSCERVCNLIWGPNVSE